jgi:uncharacterized protein
MDSAASEGGGARPLAIFKIIIAGGFGVGKTTLVGAVSEVRPLTTEEPLSVVSAGLDDLSGVEDKRATTVAMDFGRITIGKHLLLYLFGTPGQDRFWFMWDELSYGALGAVVLADTRRLADSFPSVDYFEKRHVPFVVAINCFDGAAVHDPEDVRIALDLDPHVPALLCDARRPGSVKGILIALVEHVLASGLAAGSASRNRPTALDGGHRPFPAFGIGPLGTLAAEPGMAWRIAHVGCHRQYREHQCRGNAALAGNRPVASRAGSPARGLRHRVHGDRR